LPEKQVLATPDIVMEWETIGKEAKRKLLWDNAAKCYGVE
jgi:hypothetical protein